MKDRVSRSPPLPHVAAHDQWCSALALVCSAPLSPLRGVVRLAGVAAWAHVSLPPPHRSPQCLSQSWRVLLFECSPWQPCQWVLVPTSGLSGVRSPWRCTRLFLLCSCHREEMLSFNLTFCCRLQKTVCTLSIKIQLRFLKTQLFVFVGPGWNKNLYSAGAWGPELRTTTLNLKHPQTDTHASRPVHTPTHTHTHTFTLTYTCSIKQWGTGERWYAACLDQSTRCYRSVFSFSMFSTCFELFLFL